MDKTIYSNFPIDLVYLWVDGNDPVWRAKRNKYLGVKEEKTPGYAEFSEARWRECEELKYSLRSVERYAPWINRIFILTDAQCPKWLNTQNPKVKIVDHSEILDSHVLPVFSSRPLETYLFRIDGLSEHFIFSNDDMMLSAAVSPRDFFTEDGTPIVRLMRFNRRKALKKSNYTRVVRRMQDMVKELTGSLIPYAPHHNFDAYRKSDYERCISIKSDEWVKTASRRFRHDEDMHRSFIAFYTIATGRSKMRLVSRFNRTRNLMERIKAVITNVFATDSRCIPLTKSDYNNQLQKYRPLMFCMNDGETTNDNDRERMVDFLESLFPAKSEFEL